MLTKKQLVVEFENGQLKEIGHDVEHLWDTYIIGFYDNKVFGYENVDGQNKYFFVKVNGDSFRVNGTTYRICNFI